MWSNKQEGMQFTVIALRNIYCIRNKKHLLLSPFLSCCRVIEFVIHSNEVVSSSAKQFELTSCANECTKWPTMATNTQYRQFSQVWK